MNAALKNLLFIVNFVSPVVCGGGCSVGNPPPNNFMSNGVLHTAPYPFLVKLIFASAREGERFMPMHTGCSMESAAVVVQVQLTCDYRVGTVAYTIG